MKKVLVIGCPGAGKSTFARRLQEIVGLPLYYLDLLFWNEDKSSVPTKVFISRQEEILKTDRWIIDGNYENTLEQRLRFADTIFFLDYPLEICVSGVKERCGKSRPDLPWIENEDDGMIEDLISFIHAFHKESRNNILSLLKSFLDKEIYYFKNRDEANLYLDMLCQRRI